MPKTAINRKFNIGRVHRCGSVERDPARPVRGCWRVCSVKPMTEQHLALFRRHMVEIIDMHFDLAEDEIGKAAPDPRLRRALLDVPRHLFVPQSLMVVAYQDTPLPIGFDKTISQPF